MMRGSLAASPSAAAAMSGRASRCAAKRWAHPSAPHHSLSMLVWMQLVHVQAHAGSERWSCPHPLHAKYVDKTPNIQVTVMKGRSAVCRITSICQAPFM